MSKSSKPTTKHLPKNLLIIYEDKDLLVIDKPPGLLTIATEKEKTRNAYYIMTDYVRKGYAKSRKRIFIVHRLDKEASGVLVFAKTPEAKKSLQDRWHETTKKYLAVVNGNFEKPSDTILSYLTEDERYRVHSTSDKKLGKLSKTFYKVLKATKHNSLLEIDLLTGRKHQIRVHMADCKHPILGDKKYGQRKQAAKRLALHAYKLSLIHPYKGTPCTFETGVPAYFSKLVGGFELPEVEK